MREKTKRIVGIIMAITLMVGTSGINAVAGTGVASVVSSVASNKVDIDVNPEFIVELNNTVYVLKDANGERVYPIVYNGDIYLPVRAISALLDEEIEWDTYSKTVFIGKTLTNPNKIDSKKDKNYKNAAEVYNKSIEYEKVAKPKADIGYLTKNITIVFDFKIQNFINTNGETLYPIIYHNSTYLPFFALSSLTDKKIKWDKTSKTITIKDFHEGKEDSSKNTVELKKELEKSIELYDQVTDKICNIRKIHENDKLSALAKSISEDVEQATQQNAYIKNMSTEEFSEEELRAYEDLYTFTDSSKHYMLLVENIAYMAVAQYDYSILSETFLSLVLESQEKMRVARATINRL